MPYLILSESRSTGSNTGRTTTVGAKQGRPNSSARHTTFVCRKSAPESSPLLLTTFGSNFSSVSSSTSSCRE